jgi:hypothetical protein
MPNIFKLITLSVYSLNTLKIGGTLSDWNIIKIAFGKTNNHEIIDNSILKVYYPKGSYSPSKLPVGGIGFYSNPSEIKMASEVIFTYQVRFDKTFDPVLGGKLPGLFINNGINTTGASGGKYSNNASCRIAWRSNFSAEAYLYLPTRDQDPEYNSMIIQNGIYGDSLWRHSFSFNPLEWNDVYIRLKLNKVKNNIPIKDGELEITINNNTRSFNKIIWRIDDYNYINTIIFETFFGGSTPKTATPKDTWSYFKHIKIKKLI